MIVIHDLSKTYKTANDTFKALNGLSLTIERGDIFGIIGFSGAGKSTLVRCMNRLEEPDKGSVRIGNTVITDLNERQLRKARQKIGMIFQSFNLFDGKTVFHNVAFPLRVSGYDKATIRRRVKEVLEMVQLSDKENAYPSQLSGGQKQRVGIARALVNEPDVLLCDEATSSLDPQTTYSILELLQEINRKLNLTIVLITHELDVLQHICKNVAVIEQGKIVENGTVDQFFLAPESDTARRFVHIVERYRQKRNVLEGAGAGI
ncbi:methionine ABC transporter ATP-binding protein [Cohnella sp. WQ 127256]|uniref:methionine ABC transporter ATP-binding protein n=1 Tax=Cohnella sp. WQ 127256 TaxID=2938790 RepID=UPI002117A31A|nr:ATP-binding cassette domain-containing protein [Cohnella sp. WQ 127256]